MKRSISKLALRKETIRALATIDLARAIGGQDTDAAAITLTTPKECPVAAAIDPTNPKECP